ncbi:Hypothetical protein, putative [Bodo saltans]|uniref:Uncharacterized protein n=1 Tax=Bodo saltans TaxID=75058 RepID=A0A0S4J0Z7_BODSA|nr:Hypothetical protein, putative [Bodo saltans]|eukprot:CUG48403.1 Hypothetical protein, putative [Bodo saltans]
MRGSAGSNHSDGDGGEVTSQPAPPSALVKPCPPSSLRIDASSPRSSNNVASSHSLKVMMFTPPPIRPTLSTTISTIGGSGSFSMDVKPSSQSNSSRSLKDRSGRFGTDGSVTSSSTSPSTAPLMRPATPATLSSTNQPRSPRPFSTASPGTVITVPSNANFISHHYNRTSTAHPHSRHGGDNSARPPTSRQHQKSTGTNCSSPSPAYDPKYDAFVDEWMALSSKHSSSNKPPPPASTQMNSNAQRPPNAQMYGNRARGSSAQPASSRQTRSEPRNLPVQHQVSLDALRGKSNGRAGDKK